MEPRVRPIIETVKLSLQVAEMNRPIPPSTAVSARCQRRSRNRSALRDTRIMVMAAAA
ncbi:hypothetical protein D3C81_1870710 [compost metagenome]